MTRTTLTVTEAAHLVGIGRTAGYAAAQEGHILGVPVLRARRRLVVPLRPLADALGITPEEALDVLSRDRSTTGSAA